MQVTLDGGDASYHALDWTLEARTPHMHTHIHASLHADVRFLRFRRILHARETLFIL